MTKELNQRPTEKELEILQVLWNRGPCTVREIHDVLSIISGVGYTTILKLMQIMTEKGMLSRTKDGKTHTYTALLKKEQTQKYIVNTMIDKLFQGSSLKLVMQALGNANTSAKDLDEVKQYLNDLEKGKKK